MAIRWSRAFYRRIILVVVVVCRMYVFRPPAHYVNLIGQRGI